MNARTDGTSWTERILRTLAAVFLVTWSFRLSGYLTFGPWLAIPVVLLGLTGLLAIVVAWLPQGAVSRRRQRQIDVAVLVAVIAGLGSVELLPGLHRSRLRHRRDRLRPVRGAAGAARHQPVPALHGDAFPLFHVSPNGYTFQLNGQPVTTLSYPALAFEEYLPLLALGVTTQAAVWTDVAAWALGGLVLYAVLPRKLAPLAAVVVSLDVYTGYAVGGVTDFLFIPLLIGAAAGWDRFAWTRGPAAWRGPILMGLAMAVKQTPWLIVPFVVAGIVLESRRLRNWSQGIRDGLRYLGIAVVAFLVPNLPYLLNSPSGWLNGHPHPDHRSQTVPAGQGLISLSLSLPVGGGSLSAFNAAALIVLVSLIACYLADVPAAEAGHVPAALDRPVLRHPVLRQLPGHADPGGGGGRGDGAALAAPGGLAALEMGGGRRGGILRPRGPGRPGQSQPAGHVHRVGPHHRPAGHRGPADPGGHQQLAQSVRPSFTIEEGMTMTAFWRRGARSPRAGTAPEASYTIQAPSYLADAVDHQRFPGPGLLPSPATVSRTGCLRGEPVAGGAAARRHQPAGRRGQSITVHAEIVNRLDQPIRAANVPVYLGQVIYAQGGTQPSEAYHQQREHEGETPVEALTNAQGVAVFTITSTVPEHDPVYFEANLVKSNSAYPYGYSPILAVRFRK